MNLKLPGQFFPLAARFEHRGKMFGVVATPLWRSSLNTGCPRMFYTQKRKLLRIFITIKIIEFSILIYLNDTAVLLAFWRILNQGNRPNKSENT